MCGMGKRERAAGTAAWQWMRCAKRDVAGDVLMRSVMECGDVVVWKGVAAASRKDEASDENKSAPWIVVGRFHRSRAA